MKMFPAYLLSILMFSSIAQGAVLVDTGEASGNQYIPICWDPVFGYHCNLSVGLKINLDQATTITDIKSYFYSYGAPGDLTLALYSNDYNSPGEELYQRVMTVGGPPGWNSASSLNWDVNAGSYWVVFETSQYQYFSGGLLLNAPRPLESAYTFDYGETWINRGTGLSASLVVVGTPLVAVPEPESYAMMFAGLGVLGFAGRNKQRV